MVVQSAAVEFFFPVNHSIYQETAGAWQGLYILTHIRAEAGEVGGRRLSNHVGKLPKSPQRCSSLPIQEYRLPESAFAEHAWL